MKTKMLKALSYPGQKIVSLTEDAVAYVSGNCVCVLSLSTNAMSFLTPTSEETMLGGISSIASCGTTSQLAFSSRQLNSLIDVYDYPSMEKSLSLDGGAKLDFADITFNSSGTLIASISKQPDYQLSVFDTKTKKIICSAKLPEPCSTISFNPLKDDQLCTMGEKGLFMWSLNETQEGKKLTSVKLKIKALDEEEDEDSGGEHDPEEEEDFEEAQGPRNDFVCHCWNVNGQVHAGTRAGEIFTVTATGASMIDTFPEFYASSGMDTGPPGEDEPRLVARAMYPTKAHIVIVHSDGKVRWLAPSSFEIQRVVDLATYRTVKVSTLDDLGLDNQNQNEPWVVPVTSTITPGYTTVVVGTADGVVLSLSSGQDEIADVEDFEAGKLFIIVVNVILFIFLSFLYFSLIFLYFSYFPLIHIETFLEGGSDVVVNQHIDCHADSVYALCCLNFAEDSCFFTAAGK